MTQTYLTWRPLFRRHHATAWLGLLLLFLNAFAPALIAGMSRAQAETPLEQMLQGRLVICTPTGLRLVEPEGDSQLPADEAVREVVCAFCLPLTNSGVGAVAAVAPDWHAPVPVHARPVPEALAPRPVPSRLTVAHPRAPPLVA